MIKKNLCAAFLLLVLCVSVNNVFAVPAYPNLVTVTQPDGTTLRVFLKGDERVKWAESEDGYTLLRNTQGVFEYAVKDANDNLLTSGIKAHNYSQREEAEVSFLSTCVKELTFSVNQVSENQENGPRVSFSTALTAPSNNSKGHNKAEKDANYHRIPIILVNYKDKNITYTKEDFDSLVNLKNYSVNGATGSVMDYFLSCSSGKYFFNGDIMGPYDLMQGEAYYGGNSASGGDKNPQEMVKDALAAAVKDGKDMSIYDYNKDGYIDGVHIIFPGKGEELSGDVNSIWSHEWEVYPPYTVGKVRVKVYSCSGELNQRGTLTAIGTLIHEMSHAIGLPDLYDTDYETAGAAVTPGTFDVMDQGAYNNGGKTPPLHNAWSRAKLGWLTKTNLDKVCNVRLRPAERATKAFFIETPVKEEYYVLDNRSKKGWDAYIPGKGMLIYAVNESLSGWGKNCINCKPTERGFYIKQANGGILSDAKNGTGTPFPGKSQNTEFTDNSEPSSMTSTNLPINKPIERIVEEENGDITFAFMGGSDDFWMENSDIDDTRTEGMIVDEDILVYCSPNPVVTNLNIISSYPILSTKVFSLQGQCYINRAPNNTNDVFSVADLPTGIYIIEIQTTQGFKRIKVVKK